MAGKKKGGKNHAPDSVNIKWVAKANQWCKTIVSGGNQTQIWSIEKPEK
jgi:hypothetical protein